MSRACPKLVAFENSRRGMQVMNMLEEQDS